MDTPTRPRADLGSINLLKGSIKNSMNLKNTSRDAKSAQTPGKENNRPVSALGRRSSAGSPAAKTTSHKPTVVQTTATAKAFARSDASPVVQVMATFDSNGQRISTAGLSPKRQIRKSPSTASLGSNTPDVSFSAGSHAASTSFSASNTSTANGGSGYSNAMPSPQIAHLSPKFNGPRPGSSIGTSSDEPNWGEYLVNTTPGSRLASTPRASQKTQKRPPSTPLTPGQFQQNLRRVKLGTPATTTGISTSLFRNSDYPPSHGLADDDDDEPYDHLNAHTEPFPVMPSFHIDTPEPPLKTHNSRVPPSFNQNWDSPDCHLSDSTPQGTPDTVLKMRQYINKLKTKPKPRSLFMTLVSGDNDNEDSVDISVCDDSANTSLNSSMNSSMGPSTQTASPVKVRVKPQHGPIEIDLSDLEAKLLTQRYDLEIEQMTDVLDFMKLEASLKV